MDKEVLIIKRCIKNALKEEFGFTVSTLKEITLMESGVSAFRLYALFRVGNKEYKMLGSDIKRVKR